MVGESTYMEYLGPPEKICNILSGKNYIFMDSFTVKVGYFGLRPHDKKPGTSCWK